jgi:hypothetical protein
MPSKHEQILVSAKVAGDAFGVAYGSLDKGEYQISQDVNRAAQEFANKNDYYPLRWLGRATLVAFFAPFALVFVYAAGVSIDPAEGSTIAFIFFLLVASDILFWLCGVVVLTFSHQDSLRIRQSNQARYYFEFRSGANSAIEKRLASSKKANLASRKAKSASSRTVERRTLNALARPAAQPFGVSHVGAEALCAEWMKYLGEPSAKATRARGDGGIDVESPSFIAQVKNYSGSVGVAAIRELVGVAVVDGRKPLFFTSGNYTEGSIDFASRYSLPLFLFNAEQGTLKAGNRLAAKCLVNGLEELNS